MLLRRTLLLVIAVLVPSIVRAQTPPSGTGVNAGVDLAAYDVVSVKPAQTTGGPMRLTAMQSTPDGIKWQSVPLSIMVRMAYGGFTKLPTEDNVSGLPAWGKTDYFTVQAKMSEAQAAEFKQLSKDEQEQRREVMFQALLVDRFKLRIHRETKMVPDYELVISKGGPKLKEGDINPDGMKDKSGKPIAGSLLVMHDVGNVQAQAYSMEQLANFLTQSFVGVGRVVKDKTGLTGKYNFALSFAPVRGSPSAQTTQSAAEDPASSIFTALQEQLGLKLVPGIGMIDVVVVDHVERPTEN